MTTTAKTQTASVQRRIKRFYELLNTGKYEDCYRMIDPRVRHDPASVTLFNYTQSLRAFREAVGQLEVRQINVTAHLDVPTPLYENRDFAVGQTACLGERGEEYSFQERWVREGKLWYTRSTGFVVAERKKMNIPLGRR